MFSKSHLGQPSFPEPTFYSIERKKNDPSCIEDVQNLRIVFENSKPPKIKNNKRELLIALGLNPDQKTLSKKMQQMYLSSGKITAHSEKRPIHKWHYLFDHSQR